MGNNNKKREFELLTQETIEKAKALGSVPDREGDFEVLCQQLEKNNIVPLFATYEKKLEIIRLEIGEHIIDFPTNWSIFSKLKTCVEEKSRLNHFCISDEFNVDHLHSIFSHLGAGEAHFCCHEGVITLFLLKQSDSEYSDSIFEFFDMAQQKFTKQHFSGEFDRDAA